MTTVTAVTAFRSAEAVCKTCLLYTSELAFRVHVRRETIIRLEAGKYNPSLKLAIEISRAVRAPIESLFEFE